MSVSVGKSGVRSAMVLEPRECDDGLGEGWTRLRTDRPGLGMHGVGEGCNVIVGTVSWVQVGEGWLELVQVG